MTKRYNRPFGNTYRQVHGHSKNNLGGRSSTYSAWQKMKERCGNPSCDSYPTYGGRGIQVCPRWQKFENFLADMGERLDGMQLDRIDSNGNYEPGNCRWASPKQQARNRRSNRLITFIGEKKSLAQWCEDFGLKYHTVWQRLRTGDSLQRAFRK